MKPQIDVKVGSVGRLVKAARTVVLGTAAVAAWSAAGQSNVPGNADRIQQREARLRELDQFNLDTRIKANEMVPAGQRLYVDYGAFFTFSYLSVDDNRNENHILRQSELNVYARLNLDNAQEVFVRGRGGWKDFNQGDSFDGRGDEAIDGDLDRAYYKIDIARLYESKGQTPPDTRLTLQGGRDFVYWANGLVIGQTIDGLKINVASGAVDVEVIAGVTPTRTVDFDASRPNYDHNTRRGFYGAIASYTTDRHKPFVYFLSQQDYNGDNNDFSSNGGIDTEYEYESYYIGAGSEGAFSDRLVYGLEGAFEGGQGLSNSFRVNGQFLEEIEQEQEEIQAWAVNARLEYLVPNERRTRWSVEQTFASGDEDRGNSADTFNGNAVGTKDRAFNAFGLINTGLAYAPNLSNISVTRVGVATYPFGSSGSLGRLQVGTDLLLFNKMNRFAALDEGSTDQRYLGFEPDIYMTWQVTSDVTLVFRYGVFFPGSGLISNDDERHFFFGGITFAF